MKRNKYLMTCPAMRDGYIQWVHPLTIQPHEQYRMFGGHGNFCPIKFEKRTVGEKLAGPLVRISKPRLRMLKFSEISSLFCPIEFVEVRNG